MYWINWQFNFAAISSSRFVCKQVYIPQLLVIFNGASVENYYSTRLFIAKGNSPPRAEGQRWEAQRVAEQCAETGGMMFERSEFLPPQALRQAASGEVCTDWKMLQSNSWTKEAPNAVHDCPVFGTFSKKYRKKELKKNTSEELRLRTAGEFNGERKRVFCPPTFAGEPIIWVFCLSLWCWVRCWQ